MEWKKVEVRDEDGNGFEFIEKDGLVMPSIFQKADPDTRLKQIKEFKLSKDDVLICSYPKTVIFGTYFDYYNAWEKEIKVNGKLDVLIMHFEKLKLDGLKEIQRIQEFLGLSHPQERLQKSLDKCTINNMKTDAESGKTSTMLLDKNGKSILYRKGIKMK